MLVTLQGMVPVYVRVNTKEGRVVQVVANDEEFVYVGDRLDDEVGIKRLERVEADRLPLAEDDEGQGISHAGTVVLREIALAHQIAEGQGSYDGAWPPWDWSW